MAGSAVIGALRVTLGADTAQFEQSMGRARATMKRVSASMAKASAAMAAAAAVVGVAMGRSVMKFSQEADKLAKMSRAIGVPVEELSRLKHAADLSGVGIDSLGSAVKRLSANMGEVASGTTGTASRAFDALGIAVTNSDGTMRSASATMADFARKFAAMKDGAGKTALAMAVFGKSGADLIPMLNLGAEGMNKLMAEADGLATTITTKTALAAEAFNDNLTRLSEVKKGIVNLISARMLPVFANLSGQLFAATKNSKTMAVAADVLTTALKGVVSAGVLLGAVMKAAWEGTHAVIFAAMKLSQGELAIAWEALKGGISDVGDTARATADILRQIWDETAGSAANAGATITKVSAPIMKMNAAVKSTGKAAKDAAKEAEQSQERLAATMERIGSQIGSGMAGVIGKTREFRDVLQEVFSLVASETISAILPQLISGAISGGGGLGGGGGGLFAGMFAGGGFIPPGQWGIAGEAGAEPVFGGRTGATVVPNSATGGGSNVTINLDARGADAAAVPAILARIDRMERDLPRQIDGQIMKTRQNKGGY